MRGFRRASSRTGGYGELLDQNEVEEYHIVMMKKTTMVDRR